jgi:uncharacterized membrane protein YgcG
MRKRIAWAVMWLAGAALAAAGAAVALSLLGADLFGGSSQPLTQAQVSQRLAAQRTTTSPGTPPATQPPGQGHGSSSPASAGRRTTFPTAAGVVSASCSAGLATLTTWQITTPGYEADGYSRGPAREAWIKFKSGTTEQTVTVSCPGGVPHHVISNHDAGDDRGGGRGGGGGGHGGGGGGHDDGGGSGGGSGSTPGGKGGH